jgi:1-aminocyclopropane-1-carboxylate deaminase
MTGLQHDRVTMEEISSPIAKLQNISLNILRLDRLHPIISGNKWYKLQFHLSAATQQKKKRIVTWGGAWSNHIVATAAAAQSLQLASLGIIRGEKPTVLSHTLREAECYGMQFHFISRDNYRQRAIHSKIIKEEDWEIPEGGYSQLGAQGAAGIMELFTPLHFTHIVCAVGTGTMIAGIIQASPLSTKVIGIPVLHGTEALTTAIKNLLPASYDNWSLVPGFEWGGYAKHPEGLLDFMNQWYQQTGIPTDIVYTGKLCYAVDQLIATNYFPVGSKVLMIHSGGLQGNRSLAPHTLQF